MKFIDWYNFNFVDNTIIKQHTIYIIAFRKKSYKNEDKMFESKMEIEDAISLFKDYRVTEIRTRIQNDFSMLCALLYKE